MRFTVYKVKNKGKRTQYLAFGEDFFNDPYIRGGSTFDSFIPHGDRYYQDVIAKTENVAIRRARKQNDAWEWSQYNWGDPPAKVAVCI